MTPPQKLNVATPSPAAVPGQHVKRSGTVARPQTAEERRRAQRVLLKMEVLIHIQGKSKPLHGYTHTVSASGAMVILPEGIPVNTTLTLENPKTQKKVDARVVRPSQFSSEGSLVPLEFTAPSPQFWNIFFPPVAQN